MMDSEIKRYLVNMEASISQRPRFIYYRLPGSRASSRIRLGYSPSRDERRLVAGLRRRGLRPRIWPRPVVSKSGDSFGWEVFWFVYDLFLKICFGCLRE